MAGFPAVNSMLLLDVVVLLSQLVRGILCPFSGDISGLYSTTIHQPACSKVDKLQQKK